MDENSGSNLFEVVWPSGRHHSESGDITPRLDDLNGKTIGFLWDWMFRGDEAFELVAEELKKRYPDVTFVDPTVFGNTHGPDEDSVIKELPGRLRQHHCDAVISGVGH